MTPIHSRLCVNIGLLTLFIALMPLVGGCAATTNIGPKITPRYPAGHGPLLDTNGVPVELPQAQ